MVALRSLGVSYACPGVQSGNPGLNLSGRNPDSSYEGGSVGYWEGDPLVIEAVNFFADTGMGERGFISQLGQAK